MCIHVYIKLNHIKLLHENKTVKFTLCHRPWDLSVSLRSHLVTLQMDEVGAEVGGADFWVRGGILLRPTVRGYKWLPNSTSGGAGTRVTEIFFRGEKKLSQRFLTTSCCHQLLGPTHYKFSQASKGLIFRWNVREGGLYQQVLLQRAVSHLPLREGCREGPASKRKTFTFRSEKPTPSVQHTGPVHRRSSVASTKMN